MSVCPPCSVKLRRKSMAGRLPQYLMTQMMSAPLTPNYLLLLRGSAVLRLPVFLKAVISMASAGGMYNIWLTNFWRGGFASAFLHCSWGRSGCNPNAMWSVGTYVWSLTRTLQVSAGLWSELSRLSQGRTDWLDQLKWKPVGQFWRDQLASCVCSRL